MFLYWNNVCHCVEIRTWRNTAVCPHLRPTCQNECALPWVYLVLILPGLKGLSFSLYTFCVCVYVLWTTCYSTLYIHPFQLIYLRLYIWVCGCHLMIFNPLFQLMLPYMHLLLACIIISWVGKSIRAWKRKEEEAWKSSNLCLTVCLSLFSLLLKEMESIKVLQPSPAIIQHKISYYFSAKISLTNALRIGALQFQSYIIFHV